MLTSNLARVPVVGWYLFYPLFHQSVSVTATAHSEPTSVTPTVTDDQLVNQVHTDLQSMIQGGQWLLSGYAPFTGKPMFPGLLNMSPEEARLIIYEARANNTLEQAVSYSRKLYDRCFVSLVYMDKKLYFLFSGGIHEQSYPRCKAKV